ncbi:MAG: MarR family transcriptional regulator [Candidatus Lokiarchaeota archaeon]|nr:MarR family transcriptional regulator [Candidatus Lokiarchaeota archaeon]
MAEIDYLERIKKRYGWDAFPFSLDIIPEVFAGKEKILNPVMQQLAFGSVVYIEGGYGSGKSQILKHMNYKLGKDPAYTNRYIPIYIPEPLTREVILSAFSRFDFKRRIDRIGDLLEELDGQLGGKKHVIMLIDEAQELAVQEKDTPDTVAEKSTTLQWIRALADSRGCKIFLSGLTNFGKKLNEMFRPLEDRVTLKVELKPMDVKTTRELVMERIKYFTPPSQKPISPFSEEAIEMITVVSGGYPRSILRTCQDAVIDMLQNNRESIDADRIIRLSGKAREVVMSLTAESAKEEGKKDLEREMKAVKERLSYDADALNTTDRQVLRFLATRDDVTPQAVADGCNITQGTAGNILRKLKEMGIVFRKQYGRTHSYTMYNNYRRDFMQA